MKAGSSLAQGSTEKNKSGLSLSCDDMKNGAFNQSSGFRMEPVVCPKLYQKRKQSDIWKHKRGVSFFPGREILLAQFIGLTR